MLNVDYKKPYGYCTLTQENGKKFKITFCKANCLWAEMYFYTKEEDGKRTEMAQLYSFLGDIQHLKNCLKSGNKRIKNYSNFVFYAKECNNDVWKAIRLLAEHGKKVTIK